MYFSVYFSSSRNLQTTYLPTYLLNYLNLIVKSSCEESVLVFFDEKGFEWQGNL